MKPELENDAWVDALRADLPDDRDQARLAARLAALGVLGAGALSTAAASATTSSAAATAATSSGLVARWAALSWAAKLGLGAGVSSLAVGGALAFNHAASVGDSHRADHASSTGAASSRAVYAAREVKSADGHEFAATEPSTAAIAPVVTSDAPGTGEATPPVVTANEARPVASAAVAAPARVDSELTSLGATSLPVGVAQFAANPGSVDSAPGPQATAAPTTTLREETALIDAALGALRSGHRALAARLIAEHQRRFPNGLLVQERERARAKLNASP